MSWLKDILSPFRRAFLKPISLQGLITLFIMGIWLSICIYIGWWEHTEAQKNIAEQWQAVLYIVTVFVWLKEYWVRVVCVVLIYMLLTQAYQELQMQNIAPIAQDYLDNIFAPIVALALIYRHYKNKLKNEADSNFDHYRGL